MNTKVPLFSVIIPTYNREKTIKRAVDSVLNQTFKSFELIIVDDGSKDQTEKIIGSYCDKRIIYIKHEINKGQNPSLNTGISIAKGTYISFLDSDDEWDPSMLQKVHDKFNLDLELGCVYARAISVDENMNNTFGAPPFNLDGFIYKEALAQGYISSMIALSVKKECFKRVGCFDPEFTVCQDDEICFRLAKVFKFGLIREPLAFAHNDGEMKLTNNIQNTADGWWRLFSKYKNDIVEYCGENVLAKHYYNCANYYLIAGNKNMVRKILLEAEILHKSNESKVIRIKLMLPSIVLLLLINIKRVVKMIYRKATKMIKDIIKRSPLYDWINESPSTRSIHLITFSMKKYGIINALRSLLTGDYYNDVFYEEHLGIKDGYKSLADFIYEKYPTIESVVDFGCGNAYLISFLKQKRVAVAGVDFSTKNKKYLDVEIIENIIVADISKKVDIGISDLVISTEVAEHLPKKCSKEFVRNLARHADKFLVISAAQPGQWGDGHINCQTKEYWIELFAKEGVIYEKEKTQKYIEEISQIEKICTNLPWYGNLMFFYVDKNYVKIRGSKC